MVSILMADAIPASPLIPSIPMLPTVVPTPTIIPGSPIPGLPGGEQVVQQQVVMAGGWINGYLWGAPIDMWIICMLFAIFAVILIYFVWRVFFVCPPVNGYFDADRKNFPLGIKFSKNMKLKMMPLKYAAQIFEPEDPMETEKWKQNLSQSIGQLGVVNTAILCDWHDWVENPIINEAIVIAAEHWNEGYNYTDKEGTKIEMNGHPDNKIYDYVSFSKHLYNGDLKGYFPQGIKIPPYFIVDVVRVEQYMPKQRDAASFGGWLRREAANLNKQTEKPNLTPFYLMTGAGLTILIICVIFGFLLVKH